MIIYRIISSNDSDLHKLGEENWTLSCISEGKMYFWKEEKKARKKEIGIEIISKASEYELSISYLKNIEKEQIPDYAENYQDEWIKFCYYWSEKGKTGKIRAEGEKTFEIKRRFATWMSRKKETYQKTEKPSVMDIVL